jgi:hypothetical protein
MLWQAVVVHASVEVLELGISDLALLVEHRHLAELGFTG